MRDRLVVTLKGLRFHARVGILPHEREFPQPVEMDISVTVDSTGTGADAARAVIDYRLIYEIASEAVVASHTELLEEIADRIAGRVIALPGAKDTTVAIRKPHAAVGGPLDYAEIVLERSRDA